MTIHRFRELRLLPVLFAVAFGPALPACAGDADYEPNHADEYGAPFFGEAKDVKSFDPISDVRFKAQVKGTMRFFIIQTDEDGRFKRNGLGTDVDPEDVVVTCEKAGFKTVGVLSQRLSANKFAPVSVECLLEKVK